MSPWVIFQSVAGHNTGPGDPDLLEWINDFLDHIFHLGPWTIVAVLAFIIVLIPVAIIAIYLVQQRRQSGAGTSGSKQEDV